MTQKNKLAQAHYIFRAGKLIHDKIYQTGARYLYEKNEPDEVAELSLPQKNMIMAIRNRKTVTMTDLANQLGVSPPSASAMVDRLVEKKILVREHSVEDRRKVMVRISSEAMSMMDGIEENMLAFFVDLVEKIGPETTKQWCQVLEQVESVLESPSTKPSPYKKHGLKEDERHGPK